MATTMTIDGPSPAGGDRTVAYFMDAEGSPVDKEQAKRIEIVEYKGDEVIMRTYGRIGPPEN